MKVLRWLAAGAVGLGVYPTMVARAVDDVPFAITGAAGGVVSCLGPGFGSVVPRVSGCHRFEAGVRSGFYNADDNFLSPYGRWGCSVNRGTDCDSLPHAASVDLCIKRENPRVELTWDGAGSLTSNQPRSCTNAVAKSVLGQGGEDARTRQDRDTWQFQGRPGETIDVSLQLDGSAGALGGEATLRVVRPGGAVLAARTGPLPLRLRTTIDGPVVIEAARGASSAAFRGFYVMEVTPVSSAIGERLLVPGETVEE